MDALEAIKTRRSVRVYDKKKIDKGILEQLVDAGRLAPTARSEEPWEFVVVESEENLQKIADIADHGKFIKEAAASIAVFCRDTKYYLEDGCAATENILVAANSFGVGSCWVAGDKKAYGAQIAELLGVPGELKLVSLISLGYPVGVNEKEKRSLEETLHWERF